MKPLKYLQFLSFVFLFTCFAYTTQAQNKAENLPQDLSLSTPQISFVDQFYDFGKIRLGDKIKTSFFFKNTGTKPLLLLQVQTSCGCTATQWERKSIAPNAVGEIEVTFDSNENKGQLGKQEKVILVISNAVNKEVRLHLRGEVIR